MIKKGDTVKIIAGNERGRTGKVLSVILAERVIVEGANVKKRHYRARRRGEKGQVAEKPMPIHISNVMLMEGGKRVRVGAKIAGGKKIRISRKTGKEI